jgi:hypothetical protein
MKMRGRAARRALLPAQRTAAPPDGRRFIVGALPPTRREADVIAKRFGFVLGAVLLVVGLWGFVTGGHDHELAGFGVNLSHNLVHVLSGVVALAAAAKGERAARLFCIVFGIVYGLVAVAGFASVAFVVKLLNLNRADDFLHLGIAVACLGVAAASAGRKTSMSGPAKPAV